MVDKKSNMGRRDFFKLTGGVISIAAISYYLGITDRPKSTLQTDELADYVDGGIGLPVFRAPYFQKDAQLDAFIFQANIDSLTTLCNETLNTAASSPYKYVPLLSSVILIYADMLVSSLDERDRQVGFIPETEVSFWVLTVAMKKTSNGEVPDHLAWFLPYLLVDESNSIATGREVYGFNKQAGEFKTAERSEFTADVLGFKQFDPLSIAQKERLLKLNPVPAEEAQVNWQDFTSAKIGFSNELLKFVRSDLGDDVLNFASQAIMNNVPLVFLKQFRHAADSTKACYRSIVEAPIEVTKYHEGAMLSQRHMLNIVHLDSHPLMKKLGLSEEQISKASLSIKVDFVLGHGIEY